MKTLIVYFSRTGRTKLIAEEIQKILGGDVEEIHDTKTRTGIMGWLSAGRDAGAKALTSLKPVEKDPALYNLVVVGSPTWGGSVSTPIRTYLETYKASLPDVALFSTGEGGGPEALDDMDAIIGNRSIARLHLTRKEEIDAKQYAAKLEEFTAKIQATKQ